MRKYGRKVKRKKQGNVILSFLLGLLAFVWCCPIIFLLTGALMGQGEAAGNLRPIFAGTEGFASWSLLPFQPSLRSYVELIFDTPDFFVMLWNSVKITGGILLGQVLFGIPAAWGFARYRFRFHRELFFLYIVMMMMPFQVMMLSDYLVIERMHLMDTMGAVILPGIFSTLPVFIVCRFFEEIPGELLEAARIDGAGEAEIFFRIGLPLGKSGIVSALVLQFLECWNMLEPPMVFLKTPSLRPLSMFQPQITWETAGAAFAASVFALLPAVWVFLAGHDFLEQGIQGYMSHSGQSPR